MRMKPILTSILLLLALFSGRQTNAQSNNSIAFDGINDYVSVPGASALIAGSAGLSLTAWVYPTNTAPSFPNFDGFAGFRNNTDADFYLLHYSANSVEARFRGAGGQDYTLISPVLTLNAWTHLAFTYDGAMLRLYRNGLAVDSTPASDVITLGTEDFLIGNLLYQGTSFYLGGKVDEVSLWNRALQPAELSCLHITGIDTATASGLQLYYTCNQGTAGGINTSQSALSDAAGNINGVFNNMSLTGTVSNFVSGASSFTPIVAFVCPDVSYNFNGTLVTTPGLYYDTLSNSAGCDSVVQLTLTGLIVDTSVTQNGATLTANHVGTYYQWLDCNNGYAPVPGAGSQTFAATANGTYAVLVLQGGCYDTSGCHTVSTVGLNSPAASAAISVFPTRSSTEVTIRFAQAPLNCRLQILDLSGRVMAEDMIRNISEFRFDLSRFAAGPYQLLLSPDDREPGLFRIFRE